ncbi:uncharacterized protein ATNIH1004_007130 [Aspergillus tanneri]|uniref:Ras-GEF domain-containing protein n=1 Tax=Aspergillus tanneri TaxID=1220188 RepID=A0A5M9MFJ0_9EURO|nr:uncharacterized protein ATNIH1004_007130 [Aspergillus tanneri]KAA8645711.1 hypothetical protein ATNIH1004_007130 [Aspergillus tanneri]
MQYHYQNEEPAFTSWLQAISEPKTRIYYPLSKPSDMSRISSHRLGTELSGTNLMPGQSCYPSLFRSSAEVPSFFVSYRWWEDEATTVLWAFDVQEIQRVIRYGLFRDENLPRTALQSRNASTVDSFLLTLIDATERVFIANLSHIQKVEEILRRCTVNSPPLVSWSWFPTQKDRALDPSDIAEAIDAESHLHFTRISFEEMVRYSLGYHADSVEWFFQQHTALYIHLQNYLHAFPDEVERYLAVEKHLRNRSPFAHRTLAQCLITMNPGSSPDITSNTAPAFEFIAGSIQRLFKELPPSLSSILKVLSVLGVRYQRKYVHVRNMNWHRQFNVTFSFLEDLMGSTSAADFARSLTNLDESHFSALTQQNLTDHDAVASRILIQWELLSIDVWESCTALPHMIGYIQECVQALLDIHNYHSFTAILSGLQKYSITESTFTTANTITGTAALNPVLPPNLLYFLDPSQNFIAYRQQFQGSPGIPFLFPHLQEYRECGAPALQQLFQQLRTALTPRG